MKYVATWMMAACLALGTAGCSDSTGPSGSLAVRMSIAGAALPAPGVSLNVLDVDVPGSNGTLTITRLAVVVNEFELEGPDLECDDDDGPTAGDCEDEGEFEAGPFFVDVPVDGTPLTIANDDIPEGTYTAFEFEVEDFELDDDSDDEDGAKILALLEDIRDNAVADWPTEASLLVEGSFTPTAGSAVDFRVFFAAEVEIERSIQPPLVLAAGDAKTVDIALHVDEWFALPDGSVIDLSQFDFAATGEVVEFELEFDDGVEVEYDD